ncbi:MAG: L-lactate dehydrogenase [Alphaproteobacteria bacterium]|nr:L-lactate dehydrogenase [Alphaproteobacteria bacterium]
MKIGIIGAGGVGSTTAFALIMRGIARKIVLIDQNQSRAEAEAEDIAHAAPFAFSNKIKSGDYSELKGSNIVIITAGANQKEGQTRNDLASANYKIFTQIIPKIAQYAPESILLVATNPVDIMTFATLELSDFPKSRVIGSGTVLDTARFRTLLGYHLGVSPSSIHANVLGEHGDTEVLCWSNAFAGSVQIEELAKNINVPLTKQIKKQIDDQVRNAAYKIIKGKGSTTFGIAGALARICQAINANEYAILNTSSLRTEVEGIKNVCLSLPCVIGKRGIHTQLYPKLSKPEHLLLKESAINIKNVSQTVFKQ